MCRLESSYSCSKKQLRNKERRATYKAGSDPVRSPIDNSVFITTSFRHRLLYWVLDQNAKLSAAHPKPCQQCPWFNKDCKLAAAPLRQTRELTKLDPSFYKLSKKLVSTSAWVCPLAVPPPICMVPFSQWYRQEGIIQMDAERRIIAMPTNST